MDHLIYSNPYERFMIMILERLEAVEDTLTNFQTKMTATIAAVGDKKCSVIDFNIVGLKEENYKNVSDCLGKLGCVMFFFGENTVQTIVSDNKCLVILDEISKDLNKYNVRLSSVSIKNCVDMKRVSYILNNNEEYKLYRK